MNDNSDYKKIFTQIYESNFWGGENLPKSGSRSTKNAAKPYVDEVRKFIKDHQIKSLLDIGHGDWEMWGEYEFENVEYLGIDVYDGITENLQNSRGRKGLEFRNLNAVEDSLPIAELCITKDVIQHLPTKDILIVLSKLSDYKYLIICNDYYKFVLADSIKAVRRFFSLNERFSRIKQRKNPLFMKLKRTNCDIQIGEHRCINLESEKFSVLNSQFSLIRTQDFIGKNIKRPNVVKRIYFYEKN